MIFELLFRVVVGLGELVLNLFPTGSAPYHALSLVVGGYSFFNTFLPVSEALTAFGVIIGVTLSLGAARAAIYALTKAHVLGGT